MCHALVFRCAHIKLKRLQTMFKSDHGNIIGRFEKLKILARVSSDKWKRSILILFDLFILLMVIIV